MSPLLLIIYYMFRVLFAEYFNPKNVLSLVSYAYRELNSNIEITVLSSSSFEYLKSIITRCSPTSLNMIKFVELKASHSGPLSTSLLEHVGDGYDYIEYNCGCTVNKDYLQQLKDLAKVVIFIVISFFKIC